MKDKRLRIVTSAYELILKQGVGAASMQAVADLVGISKGAIYLHFKSKDALLLAVFEWQTEQMLEEVKTILQSTSLAAKEKLAAQIRFQYQDLQKYQALFRALVSDESLTVSHSLMVFYQDFRLSWMELQRAFLSQHYGASIEPWKMDLALTLDGIVGNYLSTQVIEEVQLDIDRMVNWVVFCMDQIVAGIAQAPQQVFGLQDFPSFAEVQKKRQVIAKQQQLQSVERLLQKAQQLKLDEAKQQLALATIERLQQQLDQEQFDAILVRGLLAVLKEFRGLSKERVELSERLGFAD
ncbi:TetR/AcrR family transcriptional regulator [Pseudoalteromonas fenneropenaei]|uniref:TetR/AcrR family transcriptional regulator n=1 Tax=Pseudoalteromonas fenneropenaei TaxID=1737459 RepID=A0ABV7CJA9_9GAMM